MAPHVSGEIPPTFFVYSSIQGGIFEQAGRSAPSLMVVSGNLCKRLPSSAVWSGTGEDESF